jgi:hypothetical protein
MLESGEDDRQKALLEFLAELVQRLKIVNDLAIEGIDRGINLYLAEGGLAFRTVDFRLLKGRFDNRSAKDEVFG